MLPCRRAGASARARSDLSFVARRSAYWNNLCWPVGRTRVAGWPGPRCRRHARSARQCDRVTGPPRPLPSSRSQATRLFALALTHPSRSCRRVRLMKAARSRHSLDELAADRAVRVDKVGRNVRRLVVAPRSGTPGVGSRTPQARTPSVTDTRPPLNHLRTRSLLRPTAGRRGML